MTGCDELKVRCQKLLDTMANDPDRPFWQLELVRLTMEGFTLAVALNQQNKKTDKSYAEMLTKVESLEHRYSELLYTLSELKGA